MPLKQRNLGTLRPQLEGTFDVPGYDSRRSPKPILAVVFGVV